MKNGFSLCKNDKKKTYCLVPNSNDFDYTHMVTKLFYAINPISQPNPGSHFRLRDTLDNLECRLIHFCS